MSSVNFNSNHALTTLFISNNELKDLNLKPCTNLKTIAFENNDIQEVDLSMNSFLESIYAQKNKLSILDLKRLKNLRMLSCEYNNLTNIFLEENQQLEAIYCFCNQIKGKEMEMVCKMLPAKEEKKKGAFYVVDTAKPIEENLCTKSDVEAANNNNWLVYNYKNKRKQW